MKPTLCPTPSACFLLALFCVLLTGAFAARKDKEPADAPPQLVSTKGDAPKWSTPAQLEQFAVRGDPRACFELGTRLTEGDKLPKDLPRAQVLLEQAGQAGIADAWFRLGKIQHDGLAGPPDYKRALDYYLLAARGGIPEAQHNIGAMLVSARGVRRNYVEGLAWLIVAGKTGADSEAESQVRTRLASRPADVQAAEARAAELLRDISKATVQAGPAGKSDKPPVTVAPPKIEPTPSPKIVLPVTPALPVPPPAKP
jgi:uncharacterized protein